MGDVKLTGNERTFDKDEIIVSKTNAKGIITYANDVFLSIADYTEGEVVGKPHNVIRHPDMPRCIFKLLWETISAKEELFAYVVNRTKYGDHYWVLAHVTPSFGPNGEITGYHSNRRVPNRKAIMNIEPFYKRLSTEEKKHSTPKEGVEASYRMLMQEIADRGISYDRFIYSLQNS